MKVKLYVPGFSAGSPPDQEGEADARITKGQIIIGRIRITACRRYPDRVGTFSGSMPGSVRFWRKNARRVGGHWSIRSWELLAGERERIEAEMAAAR